MRPKERNLRKVISFIVIKNTKPVFGDALTREMAEQEAKSDS